MLMLASGGQLDKDLRLSDIDLHFKVFVGFVIQAYQSLEVNGILVYSCIVISILKYLHAGGGTLCASTKFGRVEETAIKSVSDANASAAKGILLIMAAKYESKNVS